MLPSVGCDARLLFVPVRMGGFEPTLSGIPRRRIPRLSHILSLAPAQVLAATSCRCEPAPPHEKCGAELSACLYATTVGHGCQFRRVGSNQRPSRFQRDARTI